MESQLEVLTNFLPVLINNEQIQHSVYLLLQMLNSGREIDNNLEIYFFTNFEHHKVENYAEEWLDKYLDYDFFQLFRFQKQTVSNLLSRIGGPDMNVPFSGGGLPICAYKQLLITLWWLGKGETLISVADKFNVAISTVYSIAERVLDKLINLKEHYIKWPDHLEIITVEDNFRKIGGYPGVVGAIDCCNIEFKAPKTQQDSYIDKNSRHSIKLQGIVTSNKIYTNINVGFPGSAHDGRVFKNSNLYVDITINNNLQTYFISDEYHLVGDKAYSLLIWLMSPFKKSVNLTRVQTKHNKSLSRCKVCVENTFGIMKSRWRILNFINVKSVEKAVKVIVARCVLHNFGYLNYDYWDEYEETEPEEGDAEEFRHINDHNEAIVKRYEIAQRLSRQD